MFQKTVRQILDKLGFSEIDEARDGTRAWQAIKMSTPHIVISQWDLPEISGIALLKLLRADEEFSDIPMILCISEITKADVVRAGEAGVNAIVIEPVSMEKIETKIRIIIDFEISPDANKAKYSCKGRFFFFPH